MASDDQGNPRSCFEDSLNLQAQDLSVLLHNLDLQNYTSNQQNEQNLKQLAEKGINHFKYYIEKRSRFASSDISSNYEPSWCSTWEISLFRIAGCRPSSFARLTHALSGSEFESNLTNFLHGNSSHKSILGLSAEQLLQLNDLQVKTIQAEERLTTRLASLQEEIADQPLAIIAKRLIEVGDVNGEIENVIDEFDKDMVEILREADKLRLRTLEEVLQILTPLQAVDFLAASKKLHFCVYKWGKIKGEKHKKSCTSRSNSLVENVSLSLKKVGK